MSPCSLVGEEGLNLVYDAFGPADGQPVVLLHGGGQTRGSWGSLTETLAAQGYRVTALDLRGHGESDWSPGGHYEFSYYRNDLRALLLKLRRRPILIGASLGGLTALLTVAEDPPVAPLALVLVDITPWIDPAETSKIADFMLARPEGFENLEDAARSISEFLPHRSPPGDTSGLTRNLKEAPNGRLIWRWDPAIMSRREDLQARTTRFVAAAGAVRTPSLLVRGALSRIVTPAHAAALSDIMDDLQVVEVADAGHMVAGDSNGAFDRAIVEFLNTVMAKSPSPGEPAHG